MGAGVTYVNRAFDVVGLVLDIWRKVDTQNFDFGLEVIKDRDLTIRPTKDSTL